MPGRKAKPTQLKIIQGNPGRRPLNRHEPKPSGDAAMPYHLNGRAAAIWEELAPELRRLGLLTSVDARMFAVLCDLLAGAEGEPLLSGVHLAQLRALAAEFGMTPSARTRIHGGPIEEPEDPAEKFFAAY